MNTLERHVAQILDTWQCWLDKGWSVYVAGVLTAEAGLLEVRGYTCEHVERFDYILSKTVKG